MAKHRRMKRSRKRHHRFNLLRRSHKVEVESPLVRSGRQCGCGTWAHNRRCKLGLGSANRKRGGAVAYYSRRPKKVTKRKKRS